MGLRGPDVGLGSTGCAAGVAAVIGAWFVSLGLTQSEDNRGKGHLEVHRSSCSEGLGDAVEASSIHVAFPVLSDSEPTVIMIKIRKSSPSPFVRLWLRAAHKH